MVACHSVLRYPEIVMSTADERDEARTGDTASRSVEAGDVRLAWGNAASWKARWRDESLQRHLTRPLGERLRSALRLVLRRSDRGQQST
jgi:hypothetical protein